MPSEKTICAHVDAAAASSGSIDLYTTQGGIKTTITHVSVGWGANLDQDVHIEVWAGKRKIYPDQGDYRGYIGHTESFAKRKVGPNTELKIKWTNDHATNDYDAHVCIDILEE